MMPFTDDDLQRLKDKIPDLNLGNPLVLEKHQVVALIARLEAAEATSLSYRTDSEVRHTPEQVELGLAWRATSGKS